MILPVLIMVFDILATSAAIEIFPEESRLLWGPYDLLLAFQQKHGGAGTRAATFFAGLILMLPQLGINVAW